MRVWVSSLLALVTLLALVGGSARIAVAAPQDASTPQPCMETEDVWTPRPVISGSDGTVAVSVYSTIPQCPGSYIDLHIVVRSAEPRGVKFRFKVIARASDGNSVTSGYFGGSLQRPGEYTSSYLYMKTPFGAFQGMLDPTLTVAGGQIVDLSWCYFDEVFPCDHRSPEPTATPLRAVFRVCPPGSGHIIALVRGGTLDALQKSLGTCGNPNDEDANGISALMWAARIGKTADVRLLLANRAFVNRADSSGWTALMYAANSISNDAAAIVILLLDKGAEINARNNAGFTAFAIVSGTPGIPGYAQTPMSQLLASKGGTP